MSPWIVSAKNRIVLPLISFLSSLFIKVFPKLTTRTPILLQRLWKGYVRSYWWSIILAFFFMSLYAFTTAMLAWFMQPVIDDIFKNENIRQLYVIAFILFIIFIVKGLASYGESFTLNRMGQSIIASLQKDLFSHLLTADLSFFHQRSSAQLLSRCTNDVNAMRFMISNTLTSLGKDFFSLIGLISVMFYQNWFLSSIAFFVFPLSFLPIISLGRRMRALSGEVQDYNSIFMNAVLQTFQGIRMVKSYCLETLEKHKLFSVIDSLKVLNIRTGRVRFLTSPIMETLGGMAIVTVIAYGGYQVIQGTHSAGSFFSFITALIMSYEPLKRIANLNTSLQEGLAGTERIFEVLDMRPTIISIEKAPPLKVSKGEIIFKSVSYRYTPDTPVLKNICFTVKKGQMVALVGASGAGKSTLLNLLPRFYECTEGAIEIDKQNIQHVGLSSLRQHIALVSQEILLFNESIAENIALGAPGASFSDIQKAAKMAAADAFIQELPQKYDTCVGEHGSRLSGGQRQRLMIARALLKKAPILLLDEPTAALDSHSEVLIQEALATIRSQYTCLVIAHRLSTVQKADMILVLHQGKIVEQGTHQELIAQQGAYTQLCQTQFLQRGLNK